MRRRFGVLIREPLFIVLSIYFLSIIFVNPLGEFTVNDDWIFSRQILAFRLGLWKMSSLMDPIFITQGLLGFLWSLVFGYSHTSLRILTLLVTALSAVGLYKITQIFSLKKLPTVFVLITYLFNPLVYTSAFTFMTENYFLLFFIWNLYFYLKFIRSGNFRDLIIGTVFCALATLVRQVGVFSFIVLFIFGPKKVFRLDVFATMFFAFAAFLLFPRYPISPELEGLSVFSNSFSNIANFSAIVGKLPFFLFIFPYMGFFILPLLFLFERTTFFKHKFWILVKITIVLFVAYKILEFDVFPIGSVLYLEGLHLKSWPFSNFSIFDNLFFKSVVSLLTAFSTLYLMEFLVKRFRKFSVESKFLLFVALLNFFILIFSGAFYDRYLLPGFVSVLILFTINHDFSNRRGIAPIFLAGILFMSVSLQSNFMSITRLSWKQAAHVSAKYDITTDIFILGLYRRYMHAVSTEDFIGYDKFPAGDYKCYVQPYTMDTDSKMLSFLLKLESLAEDKIMDNPSIYDGRKPDGLPRVKKHLNELEQNDEYFSLLYNLVGKKAYVGSFCVFD